MNAQEPTSSPSVENQEQDKRPLILAADDDLDTLNVIKLKLEAHELRVLTVRDGQEAITAVRQHQPALVILDVMMPRLNGFQVARMIKFDPQLKATPVILLTVRTQETDRILGTKVGADEYLTKPFDPQRLLDLVIHCLSKRKPNRTAGGSA